MDTTITSAGTAPAEQASPAITPATRLIALLGDPISHSLSPKFQNAAIQAAGVDGVYLALRCGSAELPGILRGIALAGGGGNVTVPHKGVAAESLDRRTAAVERTGVCNTFWLEDGLVCGDNTDVAGFRAAAHALAGDQRGARVLIVGAGGAARAAIAALLDDAVDSISLLNRTAARAEALIAAFPESDRIEIVGDPATLGRENFDLVVNATSLGLREDDPHPLSFDSVGRAGAALDLVYAPGETRWVREARGRGIAAADGIEMLLHQGAAAFEMWWQLPAPIKAMREALG